MSETKNSLHAVCTCTAYIVALSHLLLLSLSLSKAAKYANTIHPNCPDSCGGVPIDYPFGIGLNCSLSYDFVVICDPNNRTSIPLLYAIDYELLNISLSLGQARINTPVSFNCYEGAPDPPRSLEPFVLELGNCALQTSIPEGTIAYSVTFDERFNGSEVYNFSNCGYAMLMEDNGFMFETRYITTDELLYRKNSLVLDWYVGNTTCEIAKNDKSSYACKSNNSYCSKSYGGYLCNCSEGYHGNPYLEGGCQG
ncbi:hypothetical protein LUZ61_013693 [Rhynchospora tenuis]|uniref:Wall-associated receptor kinase galacturonan-binding domain-containing protein n=1 Tax=Rhynchospora tenuis TaxID=198213 RepID=A0AAD5W9X6_9POAL|nr:hypothetical protein LUZ61_013693 [Rhynchospora tenuis]